MYVCMYVCIYVCMYVCTMGAEKFSFLVIINCLMFRICLNLMLIYFDIKLELKIMVIIVFTKVTDYPLKI